MSILPASGIGDESTGFYNGVITRSLRLDATSSTRLESPTFSSDGGDTWTWSAWVKFHDLSKAKQILFGRSGNNACLIYNDGGTGEGELDLNDDGAVVRRSTGFFRDVSSWYHITLNGNGTVNRLWVNAVEVSFPSTANIGKLNEAVQHQIGDSANFSADFYADISIADVNFVSGTALDYSAFAEFKNGVLIPIEPSVTYGGNGFRLQFLQTGSGADSSGIGADTSGNNAHFTAVNLDSHDVIVDCPENNFCTINGEFADRTANTIDEGGLKVTTSTSGRSFSPGTFLMTSGKWYWEFRVDANSGGMGVAKVNGAGGAGAYQSVTSTSTSANSTDYYYGETNWVMYGDGIVHNGGYVGGTSGGMGSPSYPQIWGVAVDMDASPPTISYYINGSSVGSADLDTGFDYIPIAGDGSGGVSRVIHVNFGQNSTFSGTESAGTNTDGNGKGLFHDAVPSGHLALCASNLPDLTISPAKSTQADDHFNTVLYDGNGTADRAIDVGFATDWFWVKQRSGSNVHQLTDSSRGALKGLNSDQSAAENTFDSVRSFTSTGVTVGTSATTNSNGSTYVAWNWKAGGAPSADNSAGAGNTPTSNSVKIDGSNLGSALAGTIPATRLSANTTAGFSIVTYTGTGTQSDTVAHGLGVKPAWYFTKSRSEAQNWHIYHHELDASAPEDYTIFLNATNARASSSANYWNSTAPTTSVVSVGDDNSSNKSGTTYVMYCFAEIEGYSKFGSYIGSANADGAYVYTGFRPAFLLLKSSSSAGDDWFIFDNKRQTYNVIGNYFRASQNNAEQSSDVVDFFSNGFKFRASSGAVNDGTTFIYAAFADLPFKFSNAR